MAIQSRVMNSFKKGLMEQTTVSFDLDTDDDYYVMLMMVGGNYGSTVGADFSTLNSGNHGSYEFDGAGYQGSHSGSGRKKISGEVVAVGAAGAAGFGNWDVSDVVWSGVSAGSLSIEGALIFKKGASSGANVPMFYIEWPAPIAATGGDITMQINASGVLKMT